MGRSGRANPPLGGGSGPGSGSSGLQTLGVSWFGGPRSGDPNFLLLVPRLRVRARIISVFNMTLTEIEPRSVASKVGESAAIVLAPKEGKFSKPTEWLNLNVFAMSFFHLVALWTVWNVPLSKPNALLTFAMIYVRMFGLTGGYHRYFSHRYENWNSSLSPESKFYFSNFSIIFQFRAGGQIFSCQSIFRSYQTSRAFQFFMAFLGGTAFQKGSFFFFFDHVMLSSTGIPDPLPFLMLCYRCLVVGISS
jgi:hypothetical protein